MLESITPQLLPMLKDYKLNDKARFICRSIERMTAEEYHSPPSKRFHAPPATGVADMPFWWDMLGHYNLQSFTTAQSPVNKLGRFQICNDLSSTKEQVVRDMMCILCPLVT